MRNPIQASHDIRQAIFESAKNPAFPIRSITDSVIETLAICRICLGDYDSLKMRIAFWLLRL